MLTVFQKCASCLVSREVSVPRLGHASATDSEQIEALNVALGSDGWLPLGEAMWLDKHCLTEKLELREGFDF